MPKILVVGSINMDLLLLTPRIPMPGETMLSERYQFGPGGKGANQAVAAAMLGGDTTFVCRIGEDAFGSQLRQSLINKNVNVEYVNISPSKQSGFAVIMLDECGNNRIIVHLASNLDLTRKDIDCAFCQHYDGVIIQFEIAEDIVAYTCEQARNRGTPVIVDAGPSINFPLEKIRNMEILSPNETETAVLTGITPNSDANCNRAVEILKKRADAKHIVLKMGANGAMHYFNGQSTHYPAHKVNAVDTTAAGDVFTAAMTVQYLRHGDIGNAIMYANAAAALAVSKAGAQQSIPTAHEVDAFILSQSY